MSVHGAANSAATIYGNTGQPILERRAGSGRWFWSTKPYRIWTVPTDDCVAWPTRQFYRNRLVFLSNEGNQISPRWVALDRNNDPFWDKKRFAKTDLTGLWEQVERLGELAQAARELR